MCSEAEVLSWKVVKDSEKEFVIYVNLRRARRREAEHAGETRRNQSGGEKGECLTSAVWTPLHCLCITDN